MTTTLAVTGKSGSGKTTLLNALSCKISHKERVITIEDSAELRFLEHPHVVRLEARPRNAEGSGSESQGFTAGLEYFAANGGGSVRHFVEGCSQS